MKKNPKLENVGSSEVVSEILELSQLCNGEFETGKILEKLVEKIAFIMKADVASIYLIDNQYKDLVLKATVGLDQNMIDKVRLSLNEGLVGKTMEWLKPVSMAFGSKSKSFKLIPGLGEEKFASFLSIPLIHNRQPLGVMVVQNEKPIKYSHEQVHLFMMLAIPTVNVIEKAKLSGTFGSLFTNNENEKKSDIESKSYSGIGASSGIAIGKVLPLKPHKKINLEDQKLKKLSPEIEKMRLLEAFRWVEEEISHVQKKASKKFGMEELSIFDAYKMVIESQPFKDQILHEIESGLSALDSVEEVIKKYTEQLLRADDEYIKERAYDMQDVGRKITDRLIYGDQIPHDSFDQHQKAILFSENWSISDFVELDTDKTLGIISATGGASSHISILAQSLGIPAVLGLSSVNEDICEFDKVIIDGTTGQVFTNPTHELIRAFEKEVQLNVRVMERFRRLAKTKKPTPLGGQKITIGANIGIASHAQDAGVNNVEEIGLYRSEFPFLMSRSLPTEEEQLGHYSRILKSMGNKPVTIRTLDIGGDKYLPYLNLPQEENPSLGWRAIRLSLDREDLFRIQLRALFRASVFGKLRILFPMISSIEEIRKVKEIIRDVKKELRSQGYKYATKIPLGVMIEVPSAVTIADSLLEEVSFFSVGTNDLTQYLLAVDRNNSQVSKLYSSLHPSVLHAINQTAKVTFKKGKLISVCGDMASDPLSLVLLIGMGITSISVNAPDIPKIKSFISELNFKEVKRITNKALKLNSTLEIKECLIEFFKKKNLLDYLNFSSH
jgi:phosphotransferase system enzyme I (PtsP)